MAEQRCPECGRKHKQSQGAEKSKGSGVNLNALWIGGALILAIVLVLAANAPQ